MKRVNVMISDEAKEKIVDFQKRKQYRTLDEAVDGFILENGRVWGWRIKQQEYEDAHWQVSQDNNPLSSSPPLNSPLNSP